MKGGNTYVLRVSHLTREEEQKDICFDQIKNRVKVIFNTGFYVFLVFVLVWSYLLGTTVRLSASCRWSKRTTCTDTWALFGQCAQLHVGGSVCFTFCPSSSSHDTLVPLSVRMDCLILSRVAYIFSHLIMSSRGGVKVSSKPKWLRCMVPDLFLLTSVHV